MSPTDPGSPPENEPGQELEPEQVSLPEDWPRSVLKVRVDGARGPVAAQTISFIEGMVGDRAWKVSTFETRETWVLLHLPAGRGRHGEALPADADRAALTDLLGLLSAVETASLKGRKAFVVLLDDEEVGRVADGRPSRELRRDVLDPWRRSTGL